MIVNAPKHDEHRIVRAAFRGTTAESDGFEAREKSDITELNAKVINQMTCDELVRMIRVANLPALLCPDIDQHLPSYDHTVLTRLAHLAQRCCRNQRQVALGKGR